MEKITNFTQIKEIIEPIPADLFITDLYGFYDNSGRSCFLGHIHRKLNPEKNERNFKGDFRGYGARKLTAKFLSEQHGLKAKDGTDVNNEPTVNGYNEPVIKDRLMHMINDAIEAGY